MQHRQIFITEFDRQRLQELLGVAGTFGYRERDDLEALATELDRAVVVDSKDIPETVVTMNTRLVFRDLTDDSEMEVTLVFPAEADIDAGKLSILSPIGTALLGYQEGDTLEWKVPDGTSQLRIEKILYQPEAAGDHHL